MEGHVNDSKLIRKEQCPKCAEDGHDKHQDNLGVYDDGHSYCFKCFHTISSGGWKNFGKDKVTTLTPVVTLPADCTNEYPVNALAWCDDYEVSRHDIQNQNALWSDTRQRLIFPIYGENGLVAWVGRYFGLLQSPKWWIQGNIGQTLMVVQGGTKRKGLVLVEDIISAIVVSKVTPAIPLFGVRIGVDRWKKIKQSIPVGTEVAIWLDPDMNTETIKESMLGEQMGLNTRTIFSYDDPKGYNTSEVAEILTTNKWDMP